jgi:hypothetical protein
VKPIKGIYNSAGKMVNSLEDLRDGEVLSAVKHAGRPFDISICMYMAHVSPCTTVYACAWKFCVCMSGCTPAYVLMHALPYLLTNTLPTVKRYLS